MASIRITGTAKVSPEQFIAALTDFGANRSQMWANSQPEYLKIHAVGTTSADISEGSNIFGGIWERVHYDWSTPGIIRISTIESNLWDNRSGWHYQVTQAPDGSTLITYSITRYPINTRGRLVIILLALFGRQALRRDFHKTLRAIEARHGKKRAP